MAGTSKTEAPRPRSWAARPLTWVRARVTATAVPASGPGAYQASRARRPATWPTTMTAGAWKPSARARSAMLESVPSSTSCPGMVPQRTSATGVSAARPASISRRATVGRLRTPM